MTKKKTVQMEDWNPDEEKTQTQQKPETSKELEKPQVKPEIEESGEDMSMYSAIEGLPTDYKLYPEGTIIQARDLLVPEVKMLANMTEENANDIVDTILQKVVRGIDVDDIYTADKLYIMFWLRANTYKESGYNVRFECPECNTESEYAFELDQLNIKTITDETLEFLNKSFTLPNKDKITFSLLTVGDEKQNERFLKDNKNSLMNFDQEIVAVCRMIHTVNGEKLGMIAKYEYCTTKLKPMDYSYLESYLEDKGAGLEPTINVKCQKCGGASDTMLPFRPDFFFPKVRT